MLWRKLVLDQTQLGLQLLYLIQHGAQKDGKEQISQTRPLQCRRQIVCILHMEPGVQVRVRQDRRLMFVRRDFWHQRRTRHSCLQNWNQRQRNIHTVQHIQVLLPGQGNREEHLPDDCVKRSFDRFKADVLARNDRNRRLAMSTPLLVIPPHCVSRRKCTTTDNRRERKNL